MLTTTWPTINHKSDAVFKENIDVPLTKRFMKMYTAVSRVQTLARLFAPAENNDTNSQYAISPNMELDAMK
jgi:hypothetical protein